MTRPFDGMIAVDWSGAAGSAYSGIAVAQCRAGTEAPHLVPSPGRRWTRTAFVAWLAARAAERERTLVGIDCAFALPAPAVKAILGTYASAFEVWDYVDRSCDAAADYFGGGFADRAEHARFFWRSGKRPAGFAEHHRATELACLKAGLGAPESPLKLVGARQVGKGGLAGMRVLASLKRMMGREFGVWPFESADSPSVVAVELYPRLFLRMAGHGNGKVRTMWDLDHCLAALGSAAYANTGTVPSDHETDALVAAAGLRRLVAGNPAVWTPAGLDDLAIRTEGWIFGVP